MSLKSLNCSCLTRMMDFTSSSFFDININLCSEVAGCLFYYLFREIHRNQRESEVTLTQHHDSFLVVKSQWPLSSRKDSSSIKKSFSE